MGKLLRTLTEHTGGIRTLMIDPHCQYLVSGSEDKTIKIWHLESGERRQTPLGHEQSKRWHTRRQTMLIRLGSRRIVGSYSYLV